ncbi:MAG: phosphate ABC transporter permease subunit PstC [Verrucomicrobiota bacterium]
MSSLFKSKNPSLKYSDDAFRYISAACAFFIVILLTWITLQIGYQGLPALKEYGLSFIYTTTWNPVENEYGALPMIYGTVVSSLLALLLATPLGVAIAVFLSEDYLPPKVQEFFKFLIELLAAIPSVIYGLWGIAIVIPLMRDYVGTWLHQNLGWIPIFSTSPFGPGMLPAAFVLAIMILPTIAALSRTALICVPQPMKQGAEAVGATRWEVLLHVTLPYAATGIFGAVVLALGRAMGETMALAMLVGNSNTINVSILAPGNTIASLLANSFGEASGMQVAALMYISFILMVLTLVINMIAEYILVKTGVDQKG